MCTLNSLLPENEGTPANKKFKKAKCKYAFTHACDILHSRVGGGVCATLSSSRQSAVAATVPV